MKKIVFIGANNPETKRMINALNNENIQFLGFIDNDKDKKGKMFLGLPIFGGFEVVKDLITDDIYFLNLITRDCITRFITSLEIVKLGGKFCNFIHPTVNLEMVRLGVGNYLQENVIVQAGVSIAHNSSIHMGSLIGHETKIGNSTFIAHGCNISGHVNIGDCVFIGTGVSVVPRIKIGKFSTIGAGTVIIDNIPPYSVVVGNPGRIIKSNPKNYIHGNIFK